MVYNHNVLLQMWLHPQLSPSNSPELSCAYTEVSLAPYSME